MVIEKLPAIKKEIEEANKELPKDDSAMKVNKPVPNNEETKTNKEMVEEDSESFQDAAETKDETHSVPEEAEQSMETMEHREIPSITLTDTDTGAGSEELLSPHLSSENNRSMEDGDTAVSQDGNDSRTEREEVSVHNEYM